MENNRINPFNNLKKAGIAGGKLPREVGGKLQMIAGQSNVRIHSKGNLTVMSVSIGCYISC